MALLSFVFHSSATSLARGSSGFGALRSAWIDRRTVRIWRAGLHLSIVVENKISIPVHPRINNVDIHQRDLESSLWQWQNNVELNNEICELSLLLVFSLALRGLIFSGCFGFPLSLKTNTYKFQFDLNAQTCFNMLLRTPSAPWVNKLQFTIFFNDQIYLLTCHLLFITSMLQVKIKFRLKFLNLDVLCLLTLI